MNITQHWYELAMTQDVDLRGGHVFTMPTKIYLRFDSIPPKAAVSKVTKTNHMSLFGGSNAHVHANSIASLT